MPATIDAACLCKMAERGQISGALLDGPLAFDNAISSDAARTKGITSEVAGDPDILLVPDLEAGNMLAKQLSFLANADSAGLVLGARVPIILTSRADSVRSRIASCAVAVLAAHAAAPVSATHHVERRGAHGVPLGPCRRRRAHGGFCTRPERRLVQPEVLCLPALQAQEWRLEAADRSRASAPRRVSPPRTTGAKVTDQKLDASVSDGDGDRCPRRLAASAVRRLPRARRWSSRRAWRSELCESGCCDAGSARGTSPADSAGASAPAA